MLSSTKFLVESAKIIKNIPCLSTSATTFSPERIQSFRTTEVNPINHTKDHLGQFYTIDNEEKFRLFRYGGLPKTFDINAKTFQETCLMVRQPSIEIINCINKLDLSKPAVRFVLYGKKGSGKSLCLAHILHYAFKKEFLIFHLPWLGTWLRQPKDHSNSETKEGFVDQNLEISQWLGHFKFQNAQILPILKTTEDHVWNKRETTPKGAPIIELIDHGINRIKYASEVLIALSKEVKTLTINGDCKTLVCVDGFNAYFYPHTRLFEPGKKPIHPSKVTHREPFLNLTKFDWKNAVIVLTVDEIAIAQEDQISHLPR